MDEPEPLEIPCTWEEALAIARTASDHYSMTEKQQELLFHEIAGTFTRDQHPLFVELGVCNGKTGLILAYLADRLAGTYVGVDNWGLENSFDGVYKLFAAADLKGWSLVTGKTQEVVLPDQPIDLLVIDAGHDEANVSADVARWAGLVRPGGLIAFHDYDGIFSRESCHWAVRYYADFYTAEWEMTLFYHGLLVRRRP